jgi:general secretion pathway protein I
VPLRTSEQSEHSTRRAPARRRAGLSLIEVLLALAILCLSLVAIGKLVDVGTDQGLDARFYSTGARLAQAKLGEYEAGLASVSGGNSSGSFDNSDSAWTWEAVCEAQDTPNLYLVTVTVSRDARGKTFAVTMSQMMLDAGMKGSSSAAARSTTSSTGATQ